MNFIQNLRDRVALQPGVPALIDHTVRGDRIVKYASLNRLADYLAIKLREEDHIVRGDRVAILLRPSQEYYGFLFALLQVGAVPIVFDESISHKEMDSWIRRLQPQGCIISHTRWMDSKMDENLRRIEKKIVVNMLRVHSRWLRRGRLGAFEEMADRDPVLITVTHDRNQCAIGSLWNQKTLLNFVQAYLVNLKLKAAEVDLCDSSLQFLANVSAGVISVIPAGFGLLTRSTLKRQINKFKPSRVSATVDALSTLLRIQPSPLHKIFVLNAPVDQRAIEFLSTHVQHANIELLFGSPVPLAVAAFREHTTDGNANWVGDFFPNVEIKVLPSAVVSDTQNQSGKLMVQSGFLPEPIDLSDDAKVLPEKITDWVDSNVRGYLDDDQRFWMT
jgi:hypothetical protein